MSSLTSLLLRRTLAQKHGTGNAPPNLPERGGTRQCSHITTSGRGGTRQSSHCEVRTADFTLLVARGCIRPGLKTRPITTQTTPNRYPKRLPSRATYPRPVPKSCKNHPKRPPQGTLDWFWFNQSTLAGYSKRHQNQVNDPPGVPRTSRESIQQPRQGAPPNLPERGGTGLRPTFGTRALTLHARGGSARSAGEGPGRGGEGWRAVPGRGIFVPC
jgi:hypothetical protein